jgi:hypothetical protein
MSVHIGWPEAIYLAMNIGFLILGCFDKERRSALGCAVFLWVFVSLPLLWWGGFFA